MPSSYRLHRSNRILVRPYFPAFLYKLCFSNSGKARLNYTAFLSLLVTIPVLVLLQLRNLLSAPVSIPEIPRIPTIPDPAAQLNIHQPAQPLPDIPAYSHYAPRIPRFALVAPRAPNYDQHTHSQLPLLHAVLVCESPCCHHTIKPAITALIAQTFPPTDLTVVHACSSADYKKFHQNVRNALDDSSSRTSSFSLRPETLFHSCNSTLLESCALHYITNLAGTVQSSGLHYTFLLSDRILLEHTALEKAYLSIYVRPSVHVLRFQAYDLDSLEAAERATDPLLVRRDIPSLSSSQKHAVAPLPLFYETQYFQDTVTSTLGGSGPLADWIPLIRIVSNARMLRDPLHTVVNTGTPQSSSAFSLARFPSDLLPPHLFSELAFYKWTARQDRSQMYAGLDRSIGHTTDPILDLSPIPHWPVRTASKSHVMIIQPWMQMGGSEKCMIDVSNAIIDNGWGVSFVLTMPFWAEDSAGEITLQHEWLSRATHLSSDVFDLLSISTDDQATRLLRYFLETRRPDFVLMANSRWAYSHVPMIRMMLPRAVIADYNHMIHMSWNGGGMPRYAANASEHFDLHMTASNNVSVSMRRWIDSDIMADHPDRVQTCYIGTDPKVMYSGNDRMSVRQKMRARHGIPNNVTVVLFAGRFVIDKGLDVIVRVLRTIADDESIVSKLMFVLVGDGELKNLLIDLPTRPDGSQFVQVHPPAKGVEDLRRYYAMADIFLLPSINEGIALVLYEAMSAGMLVITTDVGGQRELVTSDTGILLPNDRTLVEMGNHTLEALNKVVKYPDTYARIAKYGQTLVNRKYTTSNFKKCVLNNLVRVAPSKRRTPLRKDEDVEMGLGRMSRYLFNKVREEKFHGRYAMRTVPSSVEGMVTIGIKTYVCDSSISKQVASLVRSIRQKYPRIRVILGNDGPRALQKEAFVKKDPYTDVFPLPADSGISYGRNFMVNHTSTEHFLLLDDDHLFDETTDLVALLSGMRNDRFDLVGLRVRNLPGIEEYERIGILIPRYVAKIVSLRNRNLTLCVWNENEGPSIFGILHPIKVDVLHNAFMGRTDILRKHPWRNELKVNEHMTFFLDARDAGLRVGYLPSVFVHHRSREYSDCYYRIRFREDKFRQLLRYEDRFLWDIKCGKGFPESVRQHIIQKELDV